MRASRRGWLALSVSLATFAVFAACSDDASDPTLTFPGVDGATPRFDATATENPPNTAPDAVAPDAGPTDSGASDSGPDDSGASRGRALAFDGVNDLVTMVGNPSETAFSVELWFKMATLPDAGYAARGTMFEVFTNTGGGADRFLFVDDGKACFYVYNPSRSNPKLCSANRYDDGAWHHIAGTLGNTNGMRLYVDGQEAAADAATKVSTFTWRNRFRFGYGHYGFNSPLVYMRGAVDEVRVWGVERSAAEILGSYLGSVPPSTPGIQGYWRLDESGLASTAKDEILAPDGGPGNDGTLQNFGLDGGATSPWISPGAF